MNELQSINSMKNSGFSFQKIGELLGLSRQRIFQIFHKRLTGQNVTRELARKRDGFTCQKCNKKWVKDMRRFDVHHLNGLCGKLSRRYDKKSTLDGLITLCHKCHMTLDEVNQKRENGKFSTLQSIKIKL